MNKTERNTIVTETIGLEEIFGPPTSEEYVLEMIKRDPLIYEKYLRFSTVAQEKLMSFLTGKSGVEVTYDPFFKKIMDPKAHPERTESLLSALMKQKVKIIHVEDPCGTRLVEKGSFVIMDILVRLEDKSYTDLEIQKIGYKFPAQRSSCYTADMIMREYTRLNAELGDDFQYNKMQPVRLFVLMEESTADFKNENGSYIHHKISTYDTGIKLPELENTTYIALDTFKENVHNIRNKTDAWLNFFSKTEPADVIKLVSKYPEFIDYYRDVAEFRKDPKEVVIMFSEALAIADRNAELLWIDEMQAYTKKLEDETDELRKENDGLRRESDELKKENEALKAKIAEHNCNS